ncbi:MAG: tagaturonate epimerase family protein [Faecousia sp.]
MEKLTFLLPALQERLDPQPLALYPDSWNELERGQICMADFGDFDGILYLGHGCPFRPAQTGTLDGLTLARVDLDHEAAQCLRKLLPFTAPRSVLGRERTFGMGDRLGIATLGHIRAAQKYDVYPVFAQQSMRELRLMGKTYDDVLDRVTFQVFQAGFRKGYGADGDHLKSREEVDYAISCGYTMITLDCSQHIRSRGTTLTGQALEDAAALTPELEAEYLSHPFRLPGATVEFTRQELGQAVVIYSLAIAFAKDIYDACIAGTQVDLEISIDETDTPATPAQHFFVANELKKAGVSFRTMAPRFCGEFQKGVDYMGSLEQFDREFRAHVAVADYFGYKISVHSGSDKFAVYPSVGAMTGGKYHVKTSGTSWLEAVRLVAQVDPALFRELYRYAVTVFGEARAYYHVSTEPEQIPDIDTIPDEDLPALLNDNAPRQLLHITYGKILGEKAPDGSFLFRNRLYGLWRAHKEQYASLLEQHMDHHLSLLFG